MFRFSDEPECRRSLQEAGFEDMDLLEVPLYQVADRPEEVLAMLDRGSVRAAMVVERQEEGARQRIRQAIVEGALEFSHGGEYRLSWPAIMVVARKPRG